MFTIDLIRVVDWRVVQGILNYIDELYQYDKGGYKQLVDLWRCLVNMYAKCGALMNVGGGPKRSWKR